MRRHASLAIALASALGGLAVATPSLTPGDAAAVTTAPRDGVTVRPATQREAPPKQAPTRSTSTQQAILKKVAHRDRARWGKSRGAWVPTKVGGRLAYFHKQ